MFWLGLMAGILIAAGLVIWGVRHLLRNFWNRF